MKHYLFTSLFTFFCLYISAQNVSLEWAYLYGDSGWDLGSQMVRDNSGDLVIVGKFQGSIDFDPGPDTSFLSAPMGAPELFIQKVDSSGNLLWAKQIEIGNNISNGQVDTVNKVFVATDPWGNIYVSGRFEGMVDFDPGPNTYSLSSNSALYWHTFF